MYAKHENCSGQERLILNAEQLDTADRLVAALSRALNTARPEIVGLGSFVPMAEGYLEPSRIHVVWIFDQRENLAAALENGGGRLLYQLTATALREARMQVDGIDVNVHFDTEEECRHESHGNWESRLSMMHYPARQLESRAADDKPHPMVTRGSLS